MVITGKVLKKNRHSADLFFKSIPIHIDDLINFFYRDTGSDFPNFQAKSLIKK